MNEVGRKKENSRIETSIISTSADKSLKSWNLKSDEKGSVEFLVVNEDVEKFHNDDFGVRF